MIAIKFEKSKKVYFIFTAEISNLDQLIFLITELINFKSKILSVSIYRVKIL